jgi:RNA-directed DNA polymerase
VKVKGDKSPFDGDLVYWSSRLGTHPELPSRTAKLLKQQKGKCAWCGLSFQDWDVMEVDHINPKALGGRDEWKNLQLLHRHCHDKKTAIDLIEIRKKQHAQNFNKTSPGMGRYEWEWVDDIPMIKGKKRSGSPSVTKGDIIE